MQRKELERHDCFFFVRKEIFSSYQVHAKVSIPFFHLALSSMQTFRFNMPELPTGHISTEQARTRIIY